MLKLNSYIYFGGCFLYIGLSPYLQETAVLLLFGYLGIVTHYLKKWADRIETGEANSIKKALPSVLLSILTTTVFIQLREELRSMFVFTKFSTFVIGYFGSSWFFDFIENKMSNLKNKQDEQIN